MPEIEQQNEEEEVALTVPEKQEAPLNPVVISVGVVVASSGILSLLVALIATNESWRIPTTTAGLWLLGLVGRTSETSDGRYQRGRLMGYLTANPGCHFRALMAALEMSNGQITHHLKILEDEEFGVDLMDDWLDSIHSPTIFIPDLKKMSYPCLHSLQTQIVCKERS